MKNRKHFGVEALEGRRLLAADFGIAFKNDPVPDNVQVGGKINGAALLDLTNSGDAVGKSDPKIEVRVVLRPVGGGNDVLLGVVKAKTYSGLSPSKSFNLASKLRLPAGVTAGVYQLVAIADATNAVTENSESNNEAISPGNVTVSAPFADVGVFAATTTFTGTVAPGAKGSALVTLASEGTSDAKGGVDVEILATPAGGGAAVVIGSASNVRVNIKANAVGKPLKPISITAPSNTSGSALGFTLSVRVVSNLSVPGNLTFNDTLGLPGSFSVSSGNNSGGDGVLAALGLGNVLTFKRVKNTEGNGIAGVVAEEGTYRDELGNTGQYTMFLNSTITGGDFSNQGLFTLTFPAVANGTQLIPQGIQFFNGRGSLNKKVLVFQSGEAGADGRVGSNKFFQFQ